MSNERLPLMMDKKYSELENNFPFAEHIFTLKALAALLAAMVVGSTLDRTLDYLATSVLITNATKVEALKVWWIFTASAIAILIFLIHTIDTCRLKHNEKHFQQQLQQSLQARYNNPRGLRAGG